MEPLDLTGERDPLEPPEPLAHKGTGGALAHKEHKEHPERQAHKGLTETRELPGLEAPGTHRASGRPEQPERQGSQPERWRSRVTGNDRITGSAG